MSKVQLPDIHRKSHFKKRRCGIRFRTNSKLANQKQIIIIFSPETIQSWSYGPYFTSYPTLEEEFEELYTRINGVPCEQA